MEAHYGHDGTVRSAHFDRPGGAQMNVRRGMYGERHIETIRSDHSRVVSYGPRAGYVERPFRQGYVSRTYVYGGRSYVHVYRSYYFRGVAFYGYVPAVYYHPLFYGWAYNPWPAPIVWGWGWRGNPWFGFYAGYFAPAPVYPTASLWLTDYLLAENLRLAYENRQAALQAQQYEPPPPVPADPNGAVMLSPAVKQAIAEEVRLQIEAERAAANQPAPPPNAVAPTSNLAPAALDPKQRIFVVSTPFAANSAGQECGLTSGDIIVRTSDTMSAQNTVSVSVLSSKPGDCPMNAMADVEVAALQEMHNQFQDQVDSGLKTMADNQGRNGMPSGPPPNPRQSPDGQAPADSAANVSSALSQQQLDANQALQEAQSAGAAN